MNERIKALAEQSGALWDDKYHWYVGNEQMKQFTKSIILECIACCGSQADKNNLLRHFGIPVESNVQYDAPPVHNSVTSQYTRKYNIPKE